MKKGIAFTVALLCIVGLAGCGASAPEAPNAMIPTVQVDGVHYLTTGVESAATERNDGFDGEITSAVKGSELPQKDDQSNFGEGYGYQFGNTEGTVEVCIDGEWWIYATEEVRDQIQFPERYMTLESPPALTVTLDGESVEAERGSMDWHSQADAMTDTLTSANSAQSAQGTTPVLQLNPASSMSVSLYWEVKPDKVFLRWWSEDGQDEESEFIPVKTGNEAGDSYLIELKDGNYTYEILAKWENAETYGGQCHYRFRTEK